MKISVIIPAFNEEKLLPRTLESVRTAAVAFAELGWETEIIVCDNNSRDGTAEAARAAGARVVFEPVNQISRARNTGASVATGDWFLFIDADSRPNRELLAGAAREIQTGRRLVIGATVCLDKFIVWAWLANNLWNLISRTLRYCAGSFLFCEAAAFRELGGFSTELFVSEEIDLSQRLKRLARQKGRTIIILHRHPLQTSARKMNLYSNWEHFRFLLRVVSGGRKTFRRREDCPIWYDGRR